MNEAIIFGKTELGMRSFADHTAALSQIERTLLILVDGRKTLSELARFISAMGDASAIANALELRGFIAQLHSSSSTAPKEDIANDDFAKLRATASRLIAHELGSYGDKLCSDIDAAKDSETLMRLCATAEQILTSSKGKAAAEKFYNAMEPGLAQLS